ncbi:MAG: hypothetical protein JW955_17370, partial [Sedimentisphaerales bacterium]|nr:hypothetical protein [Sedimentisphaerales bacterium]
IGSMLSHYSLAAGGKISGWRNDVNRLDNPALRAIYGLDDYATALDSWEANLNYTDSPTITYMPLSGDEFSRRAMARIPVVTILELAESGWEVQRLLECCVQRINNLANKPMHGVRPAKTASYDRFHRAAEMLQEAQDAELLRFTFEFEKDQQAAYLYAPPMPEEWKDRRTLFRELLDLPVGEYERLKLTTNSVRREPDELAIQSRSVLGVMYALAQEIAVPDDHLDKCQPATAPAAEDEQAAPRWLRVRHSRLPQPGAFVQVSYRGYWFYVDDSDWSSKRTVSLLTYLFSLQSTAKGQTGPLLTVPAGR